MVLIAARWTDTSFRDTLVSSRRRHIPAQDADVISYDTLFRISLLHECLPWQLVYYGRAITYLCGMCIAQDGLVCVWT